MSTIVFPYSKSEVYVGAYEPEQKAIIKTKTINLYDEYSDVKTFIDNLTSETLTNIRVDIVPIATNDLYVKAEGMKASTSTNSTYIDFFVYDMDNEGGLGVTRLTFARYWCKADSRPIITIPADWVVTSVNISSK